MTPAALTLEDVRDQDWDVVVLGAGPAGTVAAHQLAQNGTRILLVEKRSFPRSKVCGACLNVAGLAALQSIGLRSAIAELGGIPLNGLHLALSGHGVQLDLPGGLALSRAQLDLALVKAAVANGVNFLPATCGLIGTVHERRRHVMLTQLGRSRRISARVVLLATGLGPIRSIGPPFLEITPRSLSHVGIGCIVNKFPDFYHAQTVFMAIGQYGYIGLVRVEGNRLNVAAAVRKNWLRSSGSPGIAADRLLHEAGFTPIAELHRTTWQGTTYLTRRTWPIAGERFFVVGDGASYVEPFTGEGITQAIIAGQAITPLVTRGIHCWDPALPQAWGSLHHRLIARRQRLCRIIAISLRHPCLIRSVFKLVAHFPQVAEHIIRRIYTL
jgi:flavin-dependent dehydrogenase